MTFKERKNLIGEELDTVAILCEHGIDKEVMAKAVSELQKLHATTEEVEEIRDKWSRNSDNTRVILNALIEEMQKTA